MATRTVTLNIEDIVRAFFEFRKAPRMEFDEKWDAIVRALVARYFDDVHIDPAPGDFPSEPLVLDTIAKAADELIHNNGEPIEITVEE